MLGVPFNSDDDSFVIDVSLSTPGNAVPSRRELVSSLAKVYDPMGFATPCLVAAKFLIQESWHPSATWDSPLDPSLVQKWQKLQALHHGRLIKIPRFANLGSESVLHAFCDASGKAYGTCIYLVSSERSVLLFSKNRLLPIRSKVSTPRLELMGAVLAVRAVMLLRRGIPEFQMLKTYFWTDSLCVLAWLKRPLHDLKLFVRNRVQEIHKDAPDVWLHVPGLWNPADLVSRGSSPAKLASSNLWITGPEWLPNSSQWPTQPTELNCGSEEVSVLCSQANSKVVDNVEVFLKQFSSLSRLLRLSAWFRRFAFNRYVMQHSFKPPNVSSFLETVHQGAEPKSGPLTFTEVNDTLIGLIRSVQQFHYHEEWDALVEGLQVPKHSSIRKLHPQFDKERNIMLATPRTGEPPLVIIPRQSHLAKLVVWDVHYSLMHAGVDRVLCKVHQTYWIPQLRLLTRSQLGKCVRCRRHHGKPYAHDEGSLAPFRGKFSHPFEHTGLDFAGPFTVSNHRTVHILIFTCACIRAVHLEVTNDLSFESASHAMRRFIGRRGPAIRFYSDNAKSFVKLARHLAVPWHFIPERSPWWGGWWERLVGVIKSSLRKTLHLSLLSEDELRTVVTELESVINQRPLTYVSDVENSVSPLTPSHFIAMNLPLGDPWLAKAASLRGAYKHCLLVANRLIDRWREEYLVSLRSWRNADTPGRRPQKGDIVLVREGPKRSRWPVAVIVEVLSDHVAVIRLKGINTRRDTQLLYPLEAEPPWEGPRLEDVSSSEDPINALPHTHSEEVSQEPEVPRRDRRGRAIRLPARYRI